MTDKNKFLTSSHNSYSQALYELAEESKILGQIEDQASAVIKLITESKAINEKIPRAIHADGT